jgi:hypothetical protein
LRLDLRLGLDLRLLGLVLVAGLGLVGLLQDVERARCLVFLGLLGLVGLVAGV